MRELDAATVARYRAEAQERLRAARDHHGLGHTARVWEFAQDLAWHHGPADIAVLETAVWWHDVGRLQEKESHAARSAALAAGYLAGQGAPPAFIEAVVAAIGPHSWDGVPWTPEGVILREADKLDYLPVARHQELLAASAAGELEPDHYRVVLPHLAQFPG